MISSHVQVNQPALVKVVHEACGQKLTSVLVELSTAVTHGEEEEGESGRRFGHPGVMMDGQFFLVATLMAVDSLMASKDWQLLQPFSDEVGMNPMIKPVI